MKQKDTRSVAGIIRNNVFTYFNGIFLLISISLIMVQSYRNLTFLPTIIANVFIGIFQQLRAKKILDKLTLIAQAKYAVIREGEELVVTNDSLLQGDVIYLEGGQQIPGDAELIEGKIMVNESLLTGEADEIEKVSGGELMSGSFVVSGQCKARLLAVGSDSYIEKLTAQAKEIKEHPSEMVGDINKIIKTAGFLIIPIGVALFLQGLFVNHLSMRDAVVSMVGAVIGMIPEGLYLLVTIALALSAMRLARNQVLLHDMRSTETLARVDVLCVDKTGTITTNNMSVTEIIAPEGVKSAAVEKNSKLLAAYVNATTDNNATAQALREYYPESDELEITRQTAFSSKLKYSEIETSEECYRLGAPEFVLSKEVFEKQKKIVDKQSGLGKRVLVFAKKKGDDFTPLLFITLSNELRPNVEKTFRYLAKQDVRVVVISGDNPRTVSEIAQVVEIPNAENYVDASELVEDEQYADAVEKYTVFGRVKPEQKKRIVCEFQAKGLRVAMTGDGVNDILAMKEADCSIAMGSGSDAAMQAAQVVLLDSDFSHMEQIIAEGRRDINNLTRSATLFLYKNIFSLMLALFSIARILTYPLQPSQISLVSMFNIGLPAFLLALESNTKKQRGRFIGVTLMMAIPAALASFFAIATLTMFADIVGIESVEVGVASTYLLSLVGFMILFRICRPFNVYRRVVLGLCIAGFILSAGLFSGLFAIERISPICLALTVVFAIAQESMMRNFSLLTEWMQKKYYEWKSR